MQNPVGFGDRVGLDQAVRPKIRHHSGRGTEPFVNRLAVDRPVDDEMGNMNIFGPQLTGHGLRHRTHAELCRRKGSEAGAAAVHFEDQLSSAKKCGHLGGKVVVPIREFEQKLIAARLADNPYILCASPAYADRNDEESRELFATEVMPHFA